MIQKYFFVLIFLFLNTSISLASANLKPDSKWALAQLKEKGLKKAYLLILQKNYDKKSFEKVLKLNLLGFLAPPNHYNLVSPKAVSKSLQFLEKNRTVFKKSAQDYDVPPEVISSLLWVETRHGGITGRFHVPSVYLHLLQANRDVIKSKLFKLARKNPNSRNLSDDELRKKISEKAQWRSEWALEQLVALEKMHSDQQKNIAKLKGSHSGAFGFPQFIPSSYRTYAVSAGKDHSPNLFKTSDAVPSVAKYLVSHGWKSGNHESQIEALMKYNNSRDYAESILELSERIRKKLKRLKDDSVAQSEVGS